MSVEPQGGAGPSASELASFIAERRWFRGKARVRVGAEIVDTITLGDVRIALVRIAYEGGRDETYVVPWFSPSANTAIADAIVEGGFGDDLVALIRDGVTIPGAHGDLRARRLGEAPLGEVPQGRVGSAEQSNTAVIFGDRYILKLYRKLVEGENPEVEVLRFLSERTRHVSTPQLAGEIDYQQPGRPASAVAMLQSFVPSKGDAWAATLEDLAHFVEAARRAGEPPALPATSPFDLARCAPDPSFAACAQADLVRAERLGARTAELHAALASDASHPAFAPEPLDDAARDAMVAQVRASARATLGLLRRRRDHVPEAVREGVDRVLARAADVEARVALAAPVATKRIRVHGDYHLGQVLVTEADGREDYVIIDFEGEPARSLEERRAKQIALRDVAGMLRSFAYAGATAIGMVSGEDHARVARWLDLWVSWVSAAFLAAWRVGVEGSAAAPASEDEARALLDLFLVEKAVYEVGYELDNRPDWLAIPVRGLLSLL